MNDNRLVYSTETGRICPECGKPASSCSCKKKKAVKADKQPTGYPNDGTIRIQREVKGRKGKTVTAVFGVPLENKELLKFAKTLKRLCGAGGSVKGSRKNNLSDLALRFDSDLADPKEQNHRNSRLFR